MAAPVTVASAFNLPLRIVTAARPPLVMLRSANFTGNDRYTGMLVDLLPQLLEAAGITRPYVLYPLPSVRRAQRRSTGLGSRSAAASRYASARLPRCTVAWQRRPRLRRARRAAAARSSQTARGRA